MNVEYTRLRADKKLYEEFLMSEKGFTSTENEKIFIGKPIDFNTKKIEKY